QAAQETKPKASDPPIRPKGIVLPTPYDIGAKAAPGSGPSLVESPSPSARPPPLPNRGSKGPPPLPRKPPPLPAHSSGPPPLPSSMRPPPPTHVERPVKSDPSRLRPGSEDVLSPGPLIELLTARVASLESSDDRVGLARAHIELAIACEVLGDEARAAGHAEAALMVDPDLASAHAMLRRRKHSRGPIGTMLAPLDPEPNPLTAEPARLPDARGDKPDSVRAAWEQALTRAPHRAGALKGLEAETTERANRDSGHAAQGPEAYDALATHLSRMADAYSSEPRLAA